MARFYLSGPAQADLQNILSLSIERRGVEGRRRYAALIAAALREVASNSSGPMTRDRGDIFTGIRSFHIRHARGDVPGEKVARPAHIIYYRATQPGVVEIIRVLHERMEPALHIGDGKP
ncbi:MAG: type II toxin-antitoxin system RelE/ParE family toxin [Alphaproteobacteria bacterium]